MNEDAKTFVMELTLDSALYIARNLHPTFEEEVALMRDTLPSPEDYAVELFRRGSPSWCAISKETKRPVFAGGIVFETNWRASTWVVGTEQWPGHFRVITRWARHVISTLLRSNETPLTRIQAISPSGPDETGKWFKMMGLGFETEMPGYCRDGRPAFMYAATRT